MGGRAHTVMVQGTTSNAGKSVLTAGICRILARRGISVAPFKAQNMALAATTLADGGQIGTAQAFQARAAGVEPTSDMNPVLLKPSSQTGSQVIVDGHAVAHMGVREYHAYQAVAWPHVTAALVRLRDAYDVVVIEGAGSPAEINLRDRDIANMAVALHASAPVILTVDIERGGAFAQLVGTMDLLTEDERALVAGFIINRFRGDASLLDSGIAYLEDRFGIPVIGVVPYLEGWQGDEEDSLAIASLRESSDADLRIGMVRLPYLTSGNVAVAIAREPDATVRWVVDPHDLDGIDALVVPGTTAPEEADRWIVDRGLASAVSAPGAIGVPIVDLRDDGAEATLSDREVLRALLDDLRAARGLPALGPVELEAPIDTLADALENALALDRLFRIVGIDANLIEGGRDS